MSLRCGAPGRGPDRGACRREDRSAQFSRCGHARAPRADQRPGGRRAGGEDRERRAGAGRAPAAARQFRGAESQRPPARGPAHRRVAHRVQHGAQRRDCLCDVAAAPRRSLQGRARATGRALAGVGARGGHVPSRGQAIHAGQCRYRLARRPAAERRQTLSTDARREIPGAARRHRHLPETGGRMARAPGAGHPAQLGTVGRHHRRRGRQRESRARARRHHRSHRRAQRRRRHDLAGPRSAGRGNVVPRHAGRAPHEAGRRRLRRRTGRIARGDFISRQALGA